MSDRLNDCFWQSVSVHGDNDVRHTDETEATQPLVPKLVAWDWYYYWQAGKGNDLGTDQSSKELTELGAETLHSRNQNLINSTLCIVGLPQQRWESNVLPIRMKCNKTDCINYRDTASVN
jgi:hypothetical protein